MEEKAGGEAHDRKNDKIRLTITPQMNAFTFIGKPPENIAGKQESICNPAKRIKGLTELEWTFSLRSFANRRDRPL